MNGIATILETARLRVRQFVPEDLDALLAILGDPEVMRFVDDSRPLSREATALLIERSRESHETLGYGGAAVIASLDGRLIGYGGFVKTRICRDPELIYGFAKEHWGRGYGGEIARAMLEHGFRRLAFRRVEATVDPENAASVRILESLGMTRDRVGVDEHELPTAFYSLDRERWEAGG